VLVRRFTPLVRTCVRPHRGSLELVDDLMQVGYLGLLKAIGNYDPAFGNGLREARQAADAFTALSLDAPAGGEDASELGDLLGEEDAGFEQAVDMETVARHWDELPRRGQRILILRFLR
jgi:DNA-directed RNA polymerase specialized sigma subunit